MSVEGTKYEVGNVTTWTKVRPDGEKILGMRLALEYFDMEYGDSVKAMSAIIKPATENLVALGEQQAEELG